MSSIKPSRGDNANPFWRRRTTGSTQTPMLSLWQSPHAHAAFPTRGYKRSLVKFRSLLQERMCSSKKNIKQWTVLILVTLTGPSTWITLCIFGIAVSTNAAKSVYPAISDRSIWLSAQCTVHNSSQQMVISRKTAYYRTLFEVDVQIPANNEILFSRAGLVHDYDTNQNIAVGDKETYENRIIPCILHPEYTQGFVDLSDDDNVDSFALLGNELISELADDYKKSMVGVFIAWSLLAASIAMFIPLLLVYIRIKNPPPLSEADLQMRTITSS